MAANFPHLRLICYVLVSGHRGAHYRSASPVHGGVEEASGRGSEAPHLHHEGNLAAPPD
ncbi:uncharacterized protein V6R79_000121 [Siganus canaliculatus]